MSILIRREDVLALIDSYYDREAINLPEVKKDIQMIPTVELLMARGTNGVIIPIARPTGKWETDNLRNTICSKCGGIRRDNRIQHIAFCNCCGAKMDGQEADNDNI